MLEETFSFLKKLKKNNNREWFQKNKELYDRSREEFTIFIAQIISHLGKKDPQIASLEPPKTIFRIYRDVRFSKDKTPYKTHLSAYLNREGKNINTPGYYIHAQPGLCFISAGLYSPDALQLKLVRQEIDYNLNKWEKLLWAPKLKKTFTAGLSIEGALTRPPKGYTPDNPAIEYLKLKNFVIFREMEDEMYFKKDTPKRISENLAYATPLVRFLQEALANESN